MAHTKRKQLPIREDDKEENHNNNVKRLYEACHMQQNNLNTVYLTVLIELKIKFNSTAFKLTQI